MIKFSKDKVLLLHKILAEATGGSAGVRDEALLDSALESAYAGFGEKEFYPTKEEKGARLGYALISNHAFVDGNKRIGIYVMLSFLEMNGVPIQCTDDELVHVGLSVADGSMGYVVQHKDKFYIFDFCGNFEFFRMNKGKPTANMMALSGAIFHLKAQIAFKLQDLAYQTPELIDFRKSLVEDMVEKVRELNRDNFAVNQHLKFVELYSSPENYNALSYEDTLFMGQELSPLIEPEQDDAKALRFDALMYGIELAYLAGKKYSRARRDLVKKVSAVASVANIPEIMMQAELIDKILHTDYLDNAGINEFEHIRESLRDLIKYIPVTRIIYDTDFDDEILSIEWKESELENDDLKNYKAKAEFYVRQHQDNAVIAKLKGNVPLTEADVKVLEGILWSEVGTKQEYEAEYGTKPLGEFVREIVGLDMNAAKAAFAEFLNDTNLDSRQIYFVNQIVEYIVHNGMMKDLSVLQETPFTDQGSIVEVFTDLTVWMGIRRVIDQVNANALAA